VARDDLVAELRAPLGRVLDVGCGSGGSGPALRRAGATEIVGIEIEPDAAAVARERYDHVITGAAEEAIPALEGVFDRILLYDVIEHLVDPWAVLRSLLPRAAPGGQLHVSVPNARHWSLVRDLVLRGTFGYAEWGHRDATHLRWFTARDLRAAVEGAGWRVTRTGHARLHPASRLLARATGGLSAELLVYQLRLLAVSPST
jgi:O-antigen biosynthesis protein